MPAHPELRLIVPLTDDQLDEIRHRHATGVRIRSLAARFGVSGACIEAIVHGRPWRHLANAGITGDLFERKG